MPPPSLSERFDIEEEEGEGRMLAAADEGLSEDEESTRTINTIESNKDSLLYRRHSVSSFQAKSSPTSSTTTASSSDASSPPHLSNTDHDLWKATIAKLKQTLHISPPRLPKPTTVTTTTATTKKSSTKRLNKLIPMPIPPRRPQSQKRRSEATTQPRFNPDTNTYTRDTRSNPDHLRMISAELNMMRGRKLLSPLKPRGFLPRRKDAFIRGAKRKPSHLIQEVVY